MSTPKKRLISHRPVQPAQKERRGPLVSQFHEESPLADKHEDITSRATEFSQPDSPSAHLHTHSSKQLVRRIKFFETSPTDSPLPAEERAESTPLSSQFPSSARCNFSTDSSKLGLQIHTPKLINSLISKPPAFPSPGYADYSFSQISPERKAPSSMNVSKLESGETEVPELQYEEIESLLRQTHRHALSL